MTEHTLLAILVSVACTLSLRALPFLIFTKNRPMPDWLKRLGQRLPMAIMAVLVVYCLKDAFANPVKTGIPQGIGVLVVAASYKWKKNTLLSIFLGTAAVMLAMRLI
ncbi:MAG: AzlD domain-containing protein [Candidatus Faecivicinus sp.]|nr:AzlD domain-containing protein [Candidatus Faecivicinus sp.]